MKLISSLSLLPLLLATEATAQSASGAATPRQPTHGGAQDLAAPAPTGRTDTLLNGVSFDLSASEDESIASVQIGGYRSRLTVDGNANSQRGWNWSLKLAVPIGGHDDLTAGSTLDALSNGPKLSFNLSLLNFRRNNSNFLAPGAAFNRLAMADARRRCAAAAATDTTLTDAARSTQVAYCNNAAPDPDFAAEHSTYSDAAINRMLFDHFWRVGLEGSVSVNRFSRIDQATLAEGNRTKAQFSAAIFGGYFPSDALSAVLLRAEYQNAYKAGDETIICRPVVVNPANDCVNGIATPPRHVERVNLSVEYRRLLDSGWSLGSFAISPRASIDALSGDYELEFPLYFIPRGDWPIAPGVRVSYSSEKNDVQFGVFLNWSFSL